MTFLHDPIELIYGRLLTLISISDFPQPEADVNMEQNELYEQYEVDELETGERVLQMK